MSNLVRSVESKPIRIHIRTALKSLDMAYLYWEDVRFGSIELVESSVQEDADFSVEDP